MWAELFCLKISDELADEIARVDRTTFLFWTNRCSQSITALRVVTGTSRSNEVCELNAGSVVLANDGIQFMIYNALKLYFIFISDVQPERSVFRSWYVDHTVKHLSGFHTEFFPPFI